MSILAELECRNVFKLTGAYQALWWVVLEGSGTVNCNCFRDCGPGTGRSHCRIDAMEYA